MCSEGVSERAATAQVAGPAMRLTFRHVCLLLAIRGTDVCQLEGEQTRREVEELLVAGLLTDESGGRATSPHAYKTQNQVFSLRFASLWLTPAGEAVVEELERKMSAY